ncbi:MAG: T9SS type A sorting domain-containing protein, partial [Fluviicola sp.]
VYSVAAVVDATSYTWTLPNGWTGTSTTNSISTTAGSSGLVTVFSSNACGSSSPTSLSVNTALTPTVFSNGVSICEGTWAELEGSTDFGTLNWYTDASGGTAVGTGAQFITGILYSDTTFYVEADNNGCFNDPRIVVHVTVNAMPNIGIDISGGALNSLQNAATAYQWIDCNNSNQDILGETNQSFNPTLNGSYAVVVNLNGCIDTSACEIISNVSLEEFSSYATVLYPNPAQNQVHLYNQAGIAQVRVYSADGKLILQTMGQDKISLDLELSLQSGMYYVHVENSKSGLVEMIPFVIE